MVRLILQSNTVAPKTSRVQKDALYNIRKGATVGSNISFRWYLGILGATQVKAVNYRNGTSGASDNSTRNKLHLTV